MAEELVLDTAIRDWVLIPLSVVMVLIGVLRYFVSKLMRSPPSASPSPDPKTVKEGCVLSTFSPIPSRSGSRLARSDRSGSINHLGRLSCSKD
jgi:hypothetical protein